MSGKRKKLPIGIENFSKIREDDFYYVDKTGLIEKLLNNWGEVNLFTRPRRFGCFLQALFGQNCKIFLDIVAKRFWTLLHVQIGQSCNAPAGCVINQP